MSKSKIFIPLAALAIPAGALLLLRGDGLTFINLPGLVLVLGGTLVASIIGHGVDPVQGLLRRIPHILRQPVEVGFADRRAFVRVAQAHRRGDLRGAERALGELEDPFLEAGARLALDPQQGPELARLLQWRIRDQKERDQRDVRILGTMASFAPAFGMLGTLFGLISLLQGLGHSGLGEMGVAMGFALLSTLYGLVAANLLFKPVAIKLEDRSRQRLAWMSFLLEALVMLYERRHPLVIDEYLNSHEALPEAPPEAGSAPVALLERA